MNYLPYGRANRGLTILYYLISIDFAKYNLISIDFARYKFFCAEVCESGKDGTMPGKYFYPMKPFSKIPRGNL